MSRRAGREESLSLCRGGRRQTVSQSHEDSGSERRTKTTSLDVSLLSGRGVGVCVSDGRPCTHRKVLVEAPLFCAGKARLARVVRNIHAEDGVIGSEAYAC